MSTEKAQDIPMDLLAGTREIVAGMDPNAKKEEKEGSAKKEPTAEQLVIFDALMTRGVYEASSKFGKSKVTWRTRTAQEQEAIYRMVDNEGFSTPVAAGAAFRKLNVVFSLVNFQGKEAPKDLRERLGMVNALAGPILNALEGSLSKFDDTVAKAVEEVGLENF
jgi:hypothetical protein